MQIRYRSLAGYCYELVENYSQVLAFGLDETTIPGFITLHNSLLTLHRGYAWDGPSGPTWDSNSAMRASLVHDALYQLLRAGKVLKDSAHFRLQADVLFRDMLRQDGMGWFRAQTWYAAVRLFGAKAASPTEREPQAVVLTAP